MDVFEHAFMTDYGLNARIIIIYIEAFMKNRNWPVLENRLEQFLPAMRKAG